MSKYGKLILNEEVGEKVVREVVRKNMRTPSRVLASILGVDVKVIKKIKDEEFGRVVKVNTRAGKKWSKDEVDKLIMLSKMGYSDREIAQIIGRSVKAIRSKRRKLKEKNKKKRRWSDEEIKRLSELFKLGYTDEEVARIIGRSVRAVKAKRLEIGVVKKGSRCNIPSISFSESYIYFNSYVSRWASDRGYRYVKIETDEEHRRAIFRFLREGDAETEEDDVYKVSMYKRNFGCVVNARRIARRLKQLSIKTGKIEMEGNVIKVALI